MPALNYFSADRQTILGHYSLGQVSGIVAATLSAGSVLASFRWAPTNNSVYAVLLRVRVGLGVHTALTQADDFAFSGNLVRNFTADYSANNTQANMASLVATGASRTNVMVSSQMGTKGPQICTTAGMSGSTGTLDTDFTNLAVLNVSGTTVGLGDRGDLYVRGMEGQHALELAPNAGYVVRNVHGGPSSGTFYVYVEWTWAEVFQSMV